MADEKEVKAAKVKKTPKPRKDDGWKRSVAFRHEGVPYTLVKDGRDYHVLDGDGKTIHKTNSIRGAKAYAAIRMEIEAGK